MLKNEKSFLFSYFGQIMVSRYIRMLLEVYSNGIHSVVDVCFEASNLGEVLLSSVTKSLIL
ncbi:hypothetical protein FC70_GL000089 [Paucilactobacillus oligofermentans DSM 15707 = LMG 22743]|uniref:Uncharacterized protein n=1 Tax=Paucilactobacillus oligofermentans DSM 15707 = LMG 22743 TaxID=1423778 RepID=A0A0R1RLD6_9LACO|nr:hypothetical protein FC70_GL000089 [Paucilactobacillus oligofermentans DSM 15707 = LMG 22743]